MEQGLYVQVVMIRQKDYDKKEKENTKSINSKGNMQYQ